MGSQSLPFPIALPLACRTAVLSYIRYRNASLYCRNKRKEGLNALGRQLLYDRLKVERFLFVLYFVCDCIIDSYQRC